MPTHSPAALNSLPQKILNDAARRSLIHFAGAIDPGFQPAAHLVRIAKSLESIASGANRRLIINLPPRFGKSQITTRIFPAWFLGHNPAAQIIVASFGASLAKDFTRWQRNRIETDRYASIFPECSIRDDSRAVERWETTRGGVVVGAGIGGPLTGRGADLAVIDDPIKNYEEALSPVLQDTIWDWYQSTLRTRLHPGGRIVLVMTRWVKNDLCGRILEREPDKWEVLKFPAIDEAGNVLWPERFPREEVLEMKAGTTDRIWSALYQQDPIDIIEQIFRDPVYADPPAYTKLTAYLDPAFGGSDYSALTVGGIKEGLIYIADGVIWQGDIDETYRRTAQLCASHNVRLLYYETNVSSRDKSGLDPRDVIGREFARLRIPCKGIFPIKNKHLRIVDAVKTRWKNLRFSHRVSDQYMRQVFDYSELARHDDAPDSLAGLINELTKGTGGGIVLTGKREFERGAI